MIPAAAHPTFESQEGLELGGAVPDDGFEVELLTELRQAFSARVVIVDALIVTDEVLHIIGDDPELAGDFPLRLLIHGTALP